VPRGCRHRYSRLKSASFADELSTSAIPRRSVNSGSPIKSLLFRPRRVIRRLQGGA
jgi:hypothetical protein